MTGHQGPAITAGWLDRLRVQMLAIARRRVPEDAAEDLVQDALRIIMERGLGAGQADAPDGLPPVAWCLQVLRNVIGNHYRRARTRRRFLASGVEADGVVAPLEGLAPQRRLELIEASLDELTAGDPNCGRYLKRLADGLSVSALAEEVDLKVNALYQRLYRCRRKLREILRARGVLP
jgi:RNA polymerase sigma factor (sigma-70 family)